MTNQGNCNTFKPLLAGLLDGELDGVESKTINDHLIRCEHCRQEYESLAKDLAGLDALHIHEPQDEDLSELWRLPYSRTVRNSGLVLLIGGYVALLGYSLAQFFLSEDEWPFGKVAMAAIVIGGLITLGVVIIERVISYRTDPYKEVQR